MAYNPPASPSDNEEWKLRPTLPRRRVPIVDSVTGSLRVHSEFHRLFTRVQDEMLACSALQGESELYLDAHAALSQARKELYEWVSANAEPPAPLYTIHMRF